MWLLLGSFWKNLGYFFFQHVVVLAGTNEIVCTINRPLVCPLDCHYLLGTAALQLQTIIVFVSKQSSLLFVHAVSSSGKMKGMLVHVNQA